MLIAITATAIVTDPRVLAFREIGWRGKKKKMRNS